MDMSLQDYAAMRDWNVSTEKDGELLQHSGLLPQSLSLRSLYTAGTTAVTRGHSLR